MASMRVRALAAGVAAIAGLAQSAGAEAPEAPQSRAWASARAESAAKARAMSRAAEDGSVRVSNRGRAFVSGSDDRGSYRVELKDGEVVKLEMDGKEVALDRAVREDGVIHLLDSNGQGRFELSIQDGDTVWYVPSGANAAAGGGDGAPRVRIGVTLEDVPAALAQHLRLNNGQGVLITGVAKDGPAAKAGMEEHDVIVRIDGNDVVNAETLRKAVAARKPGETIKVRVVRRGDQKDLEVAVVEAEKLRVTEGGSDAWGWVTPRSGQGGQAGGPEVRARVEAEQQRMQALNERLRGQLERELAMTRAPRAQAWGGGMSPEAAEEIRKTVVEALESARNSISPEVMEEVRESLDRAFEEVGRGARFRAGTPAPERDLRLFGEPGRDGVIVVPPTPPAAPAPPAAPSAPSGQMRRSSDTEARLREMEDRMRRMEELLEKIAERQGR